MSPSSPVVAETDALWRVVNEPYNSNTFIQAIGDGACLVVDPGLDWAAVDAAVTELGLVPHHVCCTHGHFDHVGSAAMLQEQYHARVYLHAADERTMASANFVLMAMKRAERIKLPVLEALGPDLSLSIGEQQLRFHHAPGHTPGSCIIEFGECLFTGDTIFSRGVDVSKLPGSDPALLRDSIRRMWERFPDQAVVYPGHGRPAPFRWVKENNEQLRAFMNETGPEGRDGD